MASPPMMSAREAGALTEVGSLRSPEEWQFAILILTLAIVSLLVLYLISRKNVDGSFAMRIFVITIIVFGTLLVLSFSYSTDQIAPVVGLFGTIAGYVLGRSENKTSASNGDSNGPPPSTST